MDVHAIVSTMSITGNLLAQEAQDPGVSQMLDVFTSNTRGSTLFSTEVPSDDARTYQQLAVSLLERNINLICVNRADESLTAFTDLAMRTGDRIIYAASRRLSWSELG